MEMPFGETQQPVEKSVPLALPIGIYTFLIHKMGDAREIT